MSRSRKPLARKPANALSKENAKLTREIAELEDGLLLHQRNIEEDHNSVPGLIRQEIGGSRWQYGGSGKLHTFRSKKDLQETQETARSGQEKTSRLHEESKKKEDKSQLKVLPPKCLNEDADIQSKSTPTGGESRKGTGKSSHSKIKSVNQASWSSGTKNLDPSSKEYDAVMQGIFGEGGFPLEKQYTVQSASVGMSLFAKDTTNITEMKSKVLKRASAVLIMRPRSASDAQGKRSGQQKSTLASRNPKMIKTKGQKKSAGAPKDRKSATVVGNRRDVHSEHDTGKKYPLNKNTSRSPPPSGARKSSSDSSTLASPAHHSVHSKTSSTKTLRAASNGKDVCSEQQHKGDAQDINEDMSDVLSLFNKPRPTDYKPAQDDLISEQRYTVPPSTWDRNAVPKPWDKWMKVKDSDPNSDLGVGSNSRPSADRSKGFKVKSLDSFHQDVLNSGNCPPMGKSWTAISHHPSSLSQGKPPSSAAHLSHRHSWTGGSTSKSSDKGSGSKGAVEALTLSSRSNKQKAVEDWLEKHLSLSLEQASALSKPSPGSSSVSVGSSCSSSTLADITARAGRVNTYHSHRQVGAWLDSLGMKEVEKYENLFSQHQIEMVDVPSLTVPVLQHMGISRLGPIMKIMRGVEELRAQVSKATQKMAQKEEFHPEPILGDDFFKMPGAAGKTDTATTVADAGAETVTADDGNGKPEAAGSKLSDSTLQHNTDAEHDGKKPSASERLQTFRCSLQEMYRNIFGEEVVAEKPKENASIFSKETGQFECLDLQHEGGFSSEISSIMFNGNCALDTSKTETLTCGIQNSSVTQPLKHLDKNTSKVPSSDEGSFFQTGYLSKTDSTESIEKETSHTTKFPQSKRSGKSASQSRSSGSITKVSGKVKDRPASGKVKGQGDSSKQKPSSFKIDPGVERMAHRMADRRRKRQQEEEMLEQRLQRLREQRNAMAARHQSRTRSVERDSLLQRHPHHQLPEGTFGKERRKSDSGLEDSCGHYIDSTGEVMTSFADDHGAVPSSELNALKMEEMTHLLEEANSSRLQGMTLSKVRQLQNTLHHLEKSLMISETAAFHTDPNTPTSVSTVGAAPPNLAGQSRVPSRGSQEFLLDPFEPPVAEEETWGGKMDVVVRPQKPVNSSNHQRSGDTRSTPHDPPSSRRSRMLMRREQEGQEACSSSRLPAPHGSPLSTRRSRRGPHGSQQQTLMASSSWQHGRSAVVAQSGSRHGRRRPLVPADFNENASSSSAPLLPVSTSSETKEPVVPRVITLTFKDVMLGKGGGGDRSPLRKEEGGDGGSAARGQTAAAAPHLSMSKRQLLDEIRKEKDEHRKNVRHLKSELTRLQHKDPVIKSEIERADIEFQESDLMGEGSFCQVFQGQYQGAEVAVKRLKTPLSSQDNNYFAAEVSLLRDLRHPRVVLLVGVSTADRLPIMVLEYMAGRDLYSLIHHPSGENLDHAEFYQIARDISCGMVYLHHHRPPVLHLDLKSMNVLLTSGHRAKIADFGFSKLKHDADKKGGKWAKNKEVKGSPAWMAPELIQGGDITPKADVFSFAIILWEMTSRQHPYKGCSVYEILERVRTDRRPEIPELCPPDLTALITKCWSPNPAVRPNFKEVLKQVEDLSFPPGWRALFKAAGVPNEALDDVTSTRRIISLVNSSLESSALTAAAKPEPQSSGERERNLAKKKKGSSGPLVRDSLETCDYSLSEEEDLSLHLDDSLDTTLHNNDSLEEVSPQPSAYNPSTDALRQGLSGRGQTHNINPMSLTTSSSGGPIGGQRLAHTGTKRPGGVSAVKAFDVPLLPLESLRSPTPQAVHWSVSSLFDSVEEDWGVGGAAAVEPPGANCSSGKVSGRTLTPIVPRLALGEESSGEGVPSSSEAVQVEPAVDPLGKQPPLAPIPSQPQMEASDDEDEDKECAEGQSSLAMSARQARRLGLSRWSSHCHVLTPSPPESSSPKDTPQHGQTVTVAETTSPSQNGEETCTVQDSSSSHDQTSRKELESCWDGVPSSGQSVVRKSVSVKPVPYIPKPKEKTKLSARSSSCDVPEKPKESSQTQHKSGAETKEKAAVSGTPSPTTQNSDSSAVRTTPTGPDLTPRTISPPQTPPPSTTAPPSLALHPPPPPPPLPPPPPPLFTPSGPRFSNTSSSKLSTSAAAKEGEGVEKMAKTLASVHQELMAQVSRHTHSQQPQSPRTSSKKKRSFLKERYRGNPHISVEASALAEQKSQLRSVRLPHPSQLRDLPCTGQVFTSMTDLLRKAMEDRRFAMGENLTASSSHSQEMTEVSWSIQDS